MNVLSIKKTLTSNKGFSLVELMVVVAIIGILAAIAVPNVNKYMLKSRQGEAKTNLAAIYTAQKSFYTEYTTYATDFKFGFRPEGQVRYNVGFGTSFADASPVANTTFINLFAAGAATGCTGSCSYYTATIPNTASFNIAAASTASLTAFNAEARADFANMGGVASDSWNINQNKAVTQGTSGL